MTEIEDLKKACSFTGHRVLYKDFNREKLCEELVKLINVGVDTFLVGMALGFDTECFKVLEELREKNKIKIIACVPCPEQDLYFNKKQKKEYARMLSSADEVKVISEKYTPYCMMERNRYMVDNSEYLVVYIRRESGGTKRTLNYAVDKERIIIKV